MRTIEKKKNGVRITDNSKGGWTESKAHRYVMDVVKYAKDSNLILIWKDKK